MWPSDKKVWRPQLYSNQQKSYAIAKTHENCLILGLFLCTIYLYASSKGIKKETKNCHLQLGRRVK